MNEQSTEKLFEDVPVNRKIVISGLWVTSLFLFIYVDYFGLFIPGVMEKIIAGEVAHTGIQVSQIFLLATMTLMIIPSLMVALSLTLKANANRWTNIIVGILQIIVLIAGTIGETWFYYIYATVFEVALIALIVWYAWTWPRQEV